MAVNELNAKDLGAPAAPRIEKTVTRAYIESPSLNPSSLDVLRQFQANLNTLEDLNGRVRFVINEIRTIIRK